jgi:PIN domain nuclease of toxin-antitoxin system
VLLRLGIPSKTVEELIDETVGSIIPFTKEQSILAANLYKDTKSYGISLGDHACLALAQ